jgi:PhnB protein
MARVNPYLHFLGNTEEAFNFYKSVFGGEFAMLMRFSEIQNQEGCENMSESDLSKIMHVALPISDGNVLMATDAVGQHAKDAVIGNNISLSVSAESKEEADKIFNGLSEGGDVTMPLADTFWGAYFGMCKDKFGINWMINYDYPNNQGGK